MKGNNNMKNIQNKCILRDNNGIVTSNYGFNYEILSDLLQSGKYHDYIKDGDWIELTLENGDYFKLYANIDTYYNQGDNNKIEHHIDFISKDLIPGSVGEKWEYNDKSSSWSMRDNKLFRYGTNNGSIEEGSPFLASTKKYKKDGNLIDKLDEYYLKLPSSIRNYIVKKYHNVPIRQNKNSDYDTYNLEKETGTKWEDMGYLWIPYEREIFGSNTYGDSISESHMKQYCVFENIDEFKKKSDNKFEKNNPRFWWTASAFCGNNGHFCLMSPTGTITSMNSSYTKVGVPLCFRFQ